MVRYVHIHVYFLEDTIICFEFIDRNLANGLISIRDSRLEKQGQISSDFFFDSARKQKQSKCFLSCDHSKTIFAFSTKAVVDPDL